MSDVTIYTIAKELNMTPSMVSRAFNPEARISEEKRQIVLEAARKYNFSPNNFASRLSRKTVRIGILINSKFQVTTDNIILGIKEAHEKLKDYKIQYDISVFHTPCTEIFKVPKRSFDTVSPVMIAIVCFKIKLIDRMDIRVKFNTQILFKKLANF